MIGNSVSFRVSRTFDVAADLACLVILDHEGSVAAEFRDQANSPEAFVVKVVMQFDSPS